MVKDASQGRDRWVTTLAFDRNHHVARPIRAALADVSRHLYLVGCWSVYYS
jgi:hypothetical protein